MPGHIARLRIPGPLRGGDGGVRHARQCPPMPANARQRPPLMMWRASTIARLLAARRSGRVWTWGSNRHGQLGHGDTTQRREPCRLEALAAAPCWLVSCGQEHTLALARGGALYTFGSSVAGASVAAACAAAACPNHAARAGQLGHGPARSCAIPQAVAALSDSFVTHAACGMHHTVAATRSHGVWCWGWGQHGRLGHGTSTESNVPVRVLLDAAGVGGEAVVEEVAAGAPAAPRSACGRLTSAGLDAGGSHSLARTDSGAVWAWGSNRFGQVRLPRASAASQRACSSRLLRALSWVRRPACA